MIFSLTPQSVLIRCNNFAPPAPLVFSDELAAAIGLAYQYLGKQIPEAESLEQARDIFLSDESNKAEEKLYYLAEHFNLEKVYDNWKEMMLYAYTYHA